MGRYLQTRKFADRISSLNPWALILFVFPLPILIIGFFFYWWSVSRSDYKRVTTQFIQRQNQVLAHDAISVSREVSFLLDSAARDVQALSLITPTIQNFTRMYLGRVGKLTVLDSRDDSRNTIPLPIYNEIIYFNLRGDEQIHLKNGKAETRLRRLSQCSANDLCDVELLRKAIQLSEGEVYFGKLIRWYSKQNEAEKIEGAYLPVVYRGGDGIFLLGIDYRYFKEFLLQPTFPYERKQNLLQSYHNGNYIYILDSDLDFIAHPKYWNVMGFDLTSGQRALPMKMDIEEGARPINIKAYQGEKLKTYFERLLTRSLLQHSVDIFQASNLEGSNRVLSVTPIFVNKGQFQKTGIFGYLVLGCSVDYFEEPKEQYVPYY